MKQVVPNPLIGKLASVEFAGIQGLYTQKCIFISFEQQKNIFLCNVYNVDINQKISFTLSSRIISELLNNQETPGIKLIA